MLSSNEKPCKTTRKPTNYSYGKASTCEGKKKKKTLNKVGKETHTLLMVSPIKWLGSR